MTTLTLDQPIAIPYAGNGPASVAAQCAQIADGKYTCATPGAMIVAVDNALIQSEEFPINSVLVVAADPSSAIGYLDTAKAAAEAVVAGIVAQYPA
jgi:hypothetical protein